MNNSHSHRSVLTALAAVPVAGVPALAGVADAGEPDPVFALIDAAKQERAYLDEYFDNLDGQPASLVEAAGSVKLS